MGWNLLEWIHVAEGRDKMRALANMFVDLLDPAGNLSTSWGSIVFSKETSLHGIRKIIFTLIEVRTGKMRSRIKTRSSYTGVFIDVRVSDYGAEGQQWMQVWWFIWCKMLTPRGVTVAKGRTLSSFHPFLFLSFFFSSLFEQVRLQIGGRKRNVSNFRLVCLKWATWTGLPVAAR